MFPEDYFSGLLYKLYDSFMMILFLMISQCKYEGLNN